MSTPLHLSLPPHRPRLADAPLLVLGADLSRFLFGPYCTQTLAEFGAEVWKIENLHGGDNFRTHKPPNLEGESFGYL